MSVLTNYAKLCEPAGEDEENAYNLTITEDMSRSDVVEKIMEIVKNLDTPKVVTPWKNGYWYNKDTQPFYFHVEGEKAVQSNLVQFDHPDMNAMMSHTWKYGDFGPAKQEIVEVTGIENYNMEIPSLFLGKLPCVLNKEGDKIYFWGFEKKVDKMEWTSEEDMKKILDDREPADAPSCPYFEADPKNPRKIIWLSGKSGIISIN